MPDASGTSFDPEPGRPFMARYPGSGDIKFEPVRDVPYDAVGIPKRQDHTNALEQIGLLLLSEPAFVDPDVRYARGVFLSIVEVMREADAITFENYDALVNAFDIAVERAAHVVAAAWLRERGSIPIPAIREQR